MGFSMFYILAIAPLVAIVTAYSLIKLKHGNQALLLNIAQLLFVIVVALYAYSMPMSMIKKEMRIESSIFFVFYVIPSLINIRALRKNERK
jgi:Ca2+/Na+ antiporter